MFGTSKQHQQPLPRELAIGIAALFAIMLGMGVALWITVGSTPERHATTEPTTQPTDELLDALARELGPQTSSSQLESAISAWLSERQDAGPATLLAIGAPHR